jgi:hypothetical protein
VTAELTQSKVSEAEKKGFENYILVTRNVLEEMKRLVAAEGAV